jgi:hypothetical protein
VTLPAITESTASRGISAFVVRALRESAAVRHSLYFFGLTCAMYGFLALMVVSENQTSLERLIAQGRVTTGTVTGTDCGNHGSILRTFTPSATDPRLTDYGGIREPPACAQVHAGQRIVVVYLPADPSLNRIEDPRDLLTSNVQFLGAGVLLLPGFGLSWVALAVYKYSRGHPAYRDPIVPTLGRAPDIADVPLVVGGSRVTSRTQELPMPDDVRTLLRNEAIGLEASTVRVLAILILVLSAVGMAAAIAARHPLPLVVFGGAALALGTLGWLVRSIMLQGVRRDARSATFLRTVGAVRLTWTETRGGRVWTLRVGDRALTWLNDEVGLQLGNMPWGEADYTVADRKLLAVRDVDGHELYRRQVPQPLQHVFPFVFVTTAMVLGIVGLVIGAALVMGGGGR